MLTTINGLYVLAIMNDLTEESAFLILTSILTKYVGDKCIRYLSQRMSLFTICHQCRFQLCKFFSIGKCLLPAT